MSTPLIPISPAETLRSEIRGRVVTPVDGDWDDARRAWNLAVDQRPALVVQVADVDDVVTVVRHASTHDLRIAPQGTGHGAASLGDLNDAVLLRTDRLDRVEVDPVGRRARVGAGAQWKAVIDAAAKHGLTALAGMSMDVGVVGYTIGGGLGWLSRRYGLACNSLLAAEVVTTDGRTVRADRDNHPDLFWALRGGGGSYGIVTTVELALFPINDVVAGTLYFPIERAGEVLETWRVWTETVPDTVTSVGRLLAFPPLPELPDTLRGQRFAVVEAVMLTGSAEATALLRPLRDLAPVLDTFDTMPASALGGLHMEPTEPVPALSGHRLLRQLDATAIERLVEQAGAQADTSLVSVELRHLGGALAASDADHGVLDTIDAPFSLFAVGVSMTPELATAVRRDLAALEGALAPWDAGRSYLNFLAEADAPARVFGTAALDRLRAVRCRYDPEGRLVAPAPIDDRT